ncbi:MAG: hypothetical protein K9J16_03605 [Melioribacteraceae bacterium]|nr:hypothetical protein [Melioribacteraceae bacterium]MCF8418490.1 hypothetical protein [Melioribacteraceae bacterium]
MSNILKLFLISLIYILALDSVHGQVKLKELPGYDISEIDSLFFNSTSTREILPMNTGWYVYLPSDPQSKARASVPSIFEGADQLVYEKEFKLSSQTIKNYEVRLFFLGVNYFADIFVNDELVYKHSAGDVPFSIVIPDELLRYSSSNKLKLEIEHSPNSKSTIPLSNGFLMPSTYGGIFRDVYIQLIPKSGIANINLEYSLSQELDKATVHTIFDFANINNSDDEQNHSLSIALYDRSGNNLFSESNIALVPSGSINTKRDFQFSIDKPLLWSPENPNYHTLVVKLWKGSYLIDEVYTSILFKKVELIKEAILVNNKQYQLKGVTYIPQNKDLNKLISYTQLQTELALIKKTGFNSVRFAREVPHPYALKLCQDLGLFAFVELPINSPNDEICEAPNFIERAKRFSNSMLDEIEKYPAVISIGVGGSYLPDSKIQSEFISDVCEVIKSSKDVYTFASFIGLPQKELRNLDLIGLELFSKNINEIKDEIESFENNFGKGRLIISEAVYPSFMGSQSGYIDKNSIEAQAKYYEEIIDYSRKTDLPGFFIHSMFNYHGEFNSLYSAYNEEKSFEVGITGEGKSTNSLTYKVIESKLKQGERITIPVGVEKDEAPIFFILIAVGLSVIMGIVINARRKFREDATRALVRPYNFFADIRDQRILSGFHSYFLMLILAGSHSLLLTILLYFLRSNVLLEKIVLSFGSTWLMNLISYLAWNPFSAFIYLTIFSIALFVLISIVIKGFSYLVKNRVLYSSIYYVVTWAFLPLALMLPVELVLFKILSADIINIYIYLFLALYALWLIQRILKGVYVIFDVNPGIVYMFSFFIIFVVAGGVLFYFQLSESTIDYIINSIDQFKYI